MTSDSPATTNATTPAFEASLGAADPAALLAAARAHVAGLRCARLEPSSVLAEADVVAAVQADPCVGGVESVPDQLQAASDVQQRVMFAPSSW